MEQTLNLLEKYRVVIGTFLCLLILAVGGLLIWFDFHHQSGKVVTSSQVISLSNTQSPNASSGVSETKTATRKININQASESELDTLPGIGPAYAKRIVDYRTAHGSFNNTADLVNVSGIGEKTYSKIQDMIITSEASN